MKECQCGFPEELGTHWQAEDGECCPLGCDCQDCFYWEAFTSMEVRDGKKEE